MTAAAVDTRKVTDERIRFMGQHLSQRIKALGLKLQDLADDWEVSYGTVRNTIYWPTSTPPKPERIAALEKAAELPAGTLLEQYYAKRPDPSYWVLPADDAPSEPEPAPAKAPTRRTTAALAVKTPKAAAGPLVEVDDSPERVVDGPLRARIVRLERAVVALVPLVAGSAKVDADRLLADLRLGS
ncbi:hypothetical protein [Amycolatopsis kentuckyensis]|uniref:hypothetical protein n=1 Tax=Amycolatopsis kentuckyensis TaxID=218823 RepID=UPI003563E387